MTSYNNCPLFFLHFNILSICIDLIYFIIMCFFHIKKLIFFIATNIKIQIELSMHEITISKHHMIHKNSIVYQIEFYHLCNIYKPNLKIGKSYQITNCLTSSNQTGNLINECNKTRQNSVTSLVCFNWTFQKINNGAPAGGQAGRQASYLHRL